jgi:hypothetical protein
MRTATVIPFRKITDPSASSAMSNGELLELAAYRVCARTGSAFEVVERKSPLSGLLFILLTAALAAVAVGAVVGGMR